METSETLILHAGDTAPRQSTDLKWVGNVKAVWGEKTLSFMVVSRSTAEDRSSNGSDEWNRRLLLAASKQAEHLSPFELNDLTRSVIDSQFQEPWIAISISRTKIEELDAAADHLERVKKDFETAITRLRDFAASPPRHGFQSDARKMVDFIAECLIDCGDPQFMGMWNGEKISQIRRGITDIERRKNPNHHGYRFSQDQIREPLYNIRFPAAWWNRPPLLKDR